MDKVWSLPTRSSTTWPATAARTSSRGPGLPAWTSTRCIRVAVRLGTASARYDDRDYAVKLSRSVPVLTDEPR